MGTNSEFTDYVLRKVSATNRGKCISCIEDSIFIAEDDLTIFTRFREDIDPTDIESFRDDVDFGFNFLNQNRAESVYFVYPRSEKFKRHLTIESKNREQRVKLIPYDISR